MTPLEYNDKLLLVAMLGDLSLTAPLYKRYEDAFWDWYGEQSFEDIHYSSNFPELDFAEWFRSRILDINDSVEKYAEVLPEDLVSALKSTLPKTH